MSEANERPPIRSDGDEPEELVELTMDDVRPGDRKIDPSKVADDGIPQETSVNSDTDFRSTIGAEENGQSNSEEGDKNPSEQDSYKNESNDTIDEQVAEAEKTRRAYDEDTIGEKSRNDEQQFKQQEQARYEEFNRRRISLMRMDEKPLNEIATLFVKPKAYDAIENRVLESVRNAENHIFIITGQEHSGKMSTALFLAREMLLKNIATTAYIYVDHNLSLFEVAANAKQMQGGVVLFDLVFDKKNMMLDDLTTDYLHSNLVDTLMDYQVRFIFTVSINVIEKHRELINRFPVVVTDDVDLTEVYVKLINYYFPEGLYDEENKLLKTVKPSDAWYPSKLRSLFEEFRTHPEKILQILTENIVHQDVAYLWFNRLSMNHKLYALLIVLFENLKVSYIDEIYHMSVNELRRQGMEGGLQFIDPRRIGTRDMYNRIGIQLRGGLLEFTNSTYREEVTRQIENYQRLLWSLVDSMDKDAVFTGFVGVLKRMGEDYGILMQTEVNRGPRDILQQRRADLRDLHINELRQFRDIIANALAQLGIYHREKLYRVLTELALNDNVFVAITAALILAHIARKGEYGFIMETLGNWEKSNNFDLMWVTSPGIAYVYEAIIRDLNRIRSTLNSDETKEHEEFKQAYREEQKRQIALRETTIVYLRELLTELAHNYNKFDPNSIKQKEEQYRRQLLDEQLILLNDQIERQFGQSLKDLTVTDRENALIPFLKEHIPHIDKATNKYRQLLTTSWANQICLGIVRAIEFIAQIQPQGVAGLLEDWLNKEDREDPLWQIGRMSLNNLFEMAAHIEAPLLTRQAYPMLVLLPIAMRSNIITIGGWIQRLNLIVKMDDMQEAGILDEQIEIDRLANKNPVISAVNTIRAWYETSVRKRKSNLSENNNEDTEESEEDDTPVSLEGTNEQAAHWEREVFPALLIAMNQASHETRQELRIAILLDWTESEHPTIVRMAHAIITRSHVMDGLVLDLPVGKRRGIVVVDNSFRGNQARENYFEPLYQSIRKLSAIAPIEVHILGDTTHVYRLGVTHSSENFGAGDLELQGHHRAALIMPLLNPRDAPPVTPDQCHFVIVFNTRPLLDIDDLFGEIGKPIQSRELLSSNVFARARQQREEATDTVAWPWFGKLFLLSLEDEFHSAAIRRNINLIHTRDLTVLEMQLSRQVISTLHTVDVDELWSDLQAYVEIEQPRTEKSIRNDIKNWLSELNNVNLTHPRNDISLSISWIIVILSIENPQLAIDIIQNMLRTNNEDGSTISQDVTLDLSIRQMGVACVKMLFNFYGVENAYHSVEKHSVLLQLLPSFNRVAQHYSEMLPILDILLGWAQHPDWLERLNKDDSELVESLYSLRIKDIRPFLNWLQRYEKIPAFFSLFARVAKHVDEFVNIGKQVQIWRDQPKGKQRKSRQPGVFQPILPEDVLHDMNVLVPIQGDKQANETYQWLTDQAQLWQEQLLDPSKRSLVLEKFDRMQILVNRIQTELHTRLLGKLPELKEGGLYGIVFIDATTKESVRLARYFMQEFVNQKRNSNDEHLILTLHRLGSRELITSARHKVKINERDILDKQRRLIPLIGGALERYPSIMEIGFVVIITATQVIDYEDWAEQKEWSERLWVASIGHWKPIQGEVIVLEGKTPETVEKIRKRILGRR